jgi:hypothetical protein
MSAAETPVDIGVLREEIRTRRKAAKFGAMGSTIRATKAS